MEAVVVWALRYGWFVQSVPWSWSVGVGVPVALPLPLSYLSLRNPGLSPGVEPSFCLCTFLFSSQVGRWLDDCLSVAFPGAEFDLWLAIEDAYRPALSISVPYFLMTDPHSQLVTLDDLRMLFRRLPQGLVSGFGYTGSERSTSTSHSHANRSYSKGTRLRLGPYLCVLGLRDGEDRFLLVLEVEVSLSLFLYSGLTVQAELAKRKRYNISK